MFHLTTHAFFKALLFLGSGSVIHGCHHEQDIFRMGGLKARMPLTFWTFTIAVAAIIGLPGLAGFFSKDAILALAFDHNRAVFALLALHGGPDGLLHDAPLEDRLPRASRGARPRRMRTKPGWP